MNLPRPYRRPRRLRRSQAVRDLIAETHVSANSLVMPHFVLPSADGREEIASMPGIERLGTTSLLSQVESDLKLGIRSVLLFGLADSAQKDATGSVAADPRGLALSVAALKKEFGDELVVMTDVCLCAFTDHGHCGVVSEEGRVVNDESLAPLAASARVHAEAGADWVAPSDMMDGRVAAIREELDQAGLTDTAILSYAVKYASSYYGPFREAASSAPGQGDRRSYQMDYRNVQEAMVEAQLDEGEGADAVMVKPALAYLDVIANVASQTDLPVAAYNVSGEYSQVKAAARAGWLDEGALVRENLYAMRRAGARILITYHAREALKEGWL